MPTNYAPRLLGGSAPYTGATGSYVVRIGGVDRFVIAGTLHISNAIGRRSEGSCTVQTDLNTRFAEYTQTSIRDVNGNLVFTGYVGLNPKITKVGSVLEHSLTFIDQHYLADKRRVSAAFGTQTAGYMVRWMLTNILGAEGVTTGQIYDGVTPPLIPPFTPGPAVGTVQEATFTYCTVAEALDALVQAISDSGTPYYWQIDQWRRLWFVPYTAVVNNTLVDGSQIDDDSSPPSMTWGNPSYRTGQYITGGTAQTSQQTETRKGDGNTIAWPMKFAIATAPTVTVNGVAKTVGINGVDSGKDFYWSKGDPNITQDISATKLTSSDTLQVVYYGQYPNVTYVQDNGLVSAQAAIDGTTGIIEDVENDSTLTTTDSALQRASAFLTRYGVRVAGILSFTTRDVGYAQGQLITADMSWFGLNMAQMLIESVEIADSDGLNIFYTIAAVIGPYDTNWVSFMAKLLGTPGIANAVNVGSTQIVTTLLQIQATIIPTATATINAYSCPLPNTTLQPSTTLYPC